MEVTLKKDKTRQALLVMVSASIVGMIMLVLEVGQQAYKAGLDADITRQVDESLALARAELVAELNSEIYLGLSVATYASVNPDAGVEDWASFASQLLRETDHIFSITFAPNDVVSHVVPEGDNSPVIGLAYHTLREEYPLIVEARKSQSMRIAGPLSLIGASDDGSSKGLIVRIPIFLDPPMNERYWGVISLIMPLETVFKSRAISQLSSRFEIAIRGVDGKGQDGEVFLGDATTFIEPVSTETVYLPSGTWQIAAKLKPDTFLEKPWYIIYLVRLAGMFLTLLVLITLVFIFYLYKRAKDISLRDELTNLPNRRHFLAALRQAIAESTQRQASFAVLSIDLDGFKNVNDTYGHAAGDALLVEVAKRLHHNVRTTDLVARSGGDEFLILITRVSQEQMVRSIASGLLESVCSTPFKYTGKILDIRASGGFARFPQDAANIDDLLHVADQLMYKSKASKIQNIAQ